MLDLEGTLDNLCHNAGLYREILSLYTIQAPDLHRDLMSAIAAGDDEHAVGLAHKLKGMSATIGAKQAAELACLIEEGVKCNDPAEIHDLLTLLSAHLKQLLETIELQLGKLV